MASLILSILLGPCCLMGFSCVSCLRKAFRRGDDSGMVFFLKFDGCLCTHVLIKMCETSGYALTYDKDGVSGKSRVKNESDGKNNDD